MPAVEPSFPTARAVLMNRPADGVEHGSRRAAAVEQPQREIQHTGHRPEQPGMSHRAAERGGIFVMDFALQHSRQLQCSVATAGPGGGP